MIGHPPILSEKGNRMKKAASLLLLTLLLAIPFTTSGLACSTFVLQNDSLQVFGRN